jgi:hypothetical protein
MVLSNTASLFLRPLQVSSVKACIWTFHVNSAIGASKLRATNPKISPKKFYQNDLAMRNTADVTGGKSITVAVYLSAVGLMVTFYKIPDRKG